MSEKREQIINLTESTGIGTSYKDKFVKEGAFIIDMSDETVESAIEKLKQHKEKGNDNQVVLVGNESKESFASIISLIKNKDFGLATILVEDVNELVKEKQKSRNELLSSMNVLSDKLEKDFKKASYEYQDDVPRQKHRSGGNNRKMKKRKKARNGRGGKK